MLRVAEVEAKAYKIELEAKTYKEKAQLEAELHDKQLIIKNKDIEILQMQLEHYKAMQK